MHVRGRWWRGAHLQRQPLTPRAPGAPRPDARHFRLLDEAVAILEKAGSDGRRPDLRRALGAVDQLRDGLRGFAAEALPPDFMERLTSARLDLNLGDPEEALTALRALRVELRARGAK